MGKGRLRRVRGNYKFFFCNLIILIHHQYIYIYKLSLTDVIVFFIVGHEWDALLFYIAKNLDWMTIWIEKSQENGHSLTWDGVALLVKQAHHNGDSNIMSIILDLAYGSRDTKVHKRLLIIIHNFNINSQIDANNLDMFE